MWCEFENVDQDAKPWKCKHCGYKCRVGHAKHVCREPQAVQAQNVGPSFAQKAINFVGAAAKDVVTGMKRCSDEEMDSRLKICKGSKDEGIPPCPFWTPTKDGNGSCRSCGCPVSRDHVYRNKIAWKSESCPEGKWGPITEKD